MIEPISVSMVAAAEMLGISDTHLANNYKAWGVPHVRLGARTVFPVAELRQWISDEALKQKAA